MESTRTYDSAGRCIRIEVGIGDHAVKIEQTFLPLPAIWITIDGETRPFLEMGSDNEGVVVDPTEQSITHHFMADPLYVLANHTDMDIARFAAKAFGRLDGPVLRHAHAVPQWYSIA